MSDFEIAVEKVKNVPILVKHPEKEEIDKVLDKAEVLPSTIDSKNLGIINTKDGLKMPIWCDDMIEKNKSLVIIAGIDLISIEQQEKFYELLCYKTLTSVEFVSNLKIIVTYLDIKNVSQTIRSLCQIMR